MMLRLSLLLLLLLLLPGPARSVLLGWVESPGYPSGYLPHASLNWSRCAPKGHSLSIRLIHLDLEDSQDCQNDAVKVFSNGSLISVLCGKKEFAELESSVNPSLVSASGGCLSLTFHSDFSNTKRFTGFRGFYSDQDFDECKDDPDNACTQFCHNYIGGYHCSCRHGYFLDEDKHTCTVSCSEDMSGRSEGDVSSPSWPVSYAENADCQYVLSVDATLQLELSFAEGFDVEQSPDGQCIDTLTIETSSGTLGPFCGRTPPPSPLLTHSHSVRLRFSSDGFGTNKGFSLHFRTREKVCPAVVTPRSSVAPQQQEYRGGETVTVTCDLGFVANSDRAQAVTSQYETTCLNTGEWSPNYICEPVDCGFPQIPSDGLLQMVGSETQYKDQIHFSCSSKYYTLDGDDTFSCGASGKWESGDGQTQMPRCIEVCGKPEKHPASSGRIMGGKEAKLGEIPWSLLIRQPRAGASLISDRWAVTAAHVVEEAPSVRLYGGLVDGQTSETSPHVVIMDSERIIIHPGYVKGIPPEERTDYDNDIALIRFTSRVSLGPNLLPICLPEVNRGFLENEQGTVSGWGATGTRLRSSMLQFTHIGVYPRSECGNTPSTSKTNRRTVFTNNMFCAGEQGKDSCKGDSGGPFVSPTLAEGRERYYLTGIVSWGALCRQRQYKGYYTKVENYVTWIKETIDQIEKA